MLSPRPRSLLGLILTGFLLVAVPLIAAMIWAVLQVDRLALQSERLLVTGVQVTRASENLARQLVTLERTARQYRVLADEELLDLYRQRHARLSGSLRSLSRLLPPQQDRGKLTSIREGAGGILQSLAENAPDSEAVRQAIERFDELQTRAESLTRERKIIIDEAVGSLRDSAADARRMLIGLSLILIPLAIALVGGFTVLIGRRFRELSRSIRQLGDGEFRRPIAIAGPPEFQSLGLDLEWLRQRLVEADEQKNSFLRHVSHELKTPLAGLREGTELLVDGDLGELSDRQREVAAILRDHGLELQRLIENLLDFSAWQAQRTQLSRQRVLLHELVETMLEKFRLSIASRGLHIRRELQEVVLAADDGMLTKVLENLLSNAVKYTPEGGSILVRTSRQGRHVNLEIGDNGPGIPEDERQRIFQPFYRGGAPAGGHVRGTGIGLSLVREIVHAHGGTVELVDGELRGAHFRVVLPIEAGAVTGELPAVAAQ